MSKQHAEMYRVPHMHNNNMLESATAAKQHNASTVQFKKKILAHDHASGDNEQMLQPCALS